MKIESGSTQLDVSAGATGSFAATSFSTKALVNELIAGSPPGAPLDAQAVLDAHPELTNHKSAVIDLAYEEFCQCGEMGMPVDPAEFAARFPTICRSLLRLIEVHHVIVAGRASEGAVAEPAWPAPGAAWLDFQVLEELGRGAFSRVYLAREPSLGDRLVVIKATPLGPREAHTLGRLQHPHVAPVHSVRRDEQLGLTAFCMPYLSRATLFDVMDALYSAPQPPTRAADLLEAVRRQNASTAGAPEEAPAATWPPHWPFTDAVLQIGLQLAQALQHAHAQGVVHGDVKPSNVLITNSGRAVLLDFNLAIYGNDSAPVVSGTLPYMAPEQLRSVALRGTAQEQPVDARTDVFGLGMTLFELLYGKPAFGTLPHETSRDRLAARLLERQEQGPNVRTGRNGKTDRVVEKIIARCLEFDPALRPQSMEELAGLLSAQLKTRQRVRRWLGTHRRLALGAATILCASLLGLAGWQASREPYPIRMWQHGIAAFERGDDAQAILDLNEALEGNPKLVEAQLLRSRAYLRQKNFVGAYTDLEALVRTHPDGRAAAALGHVFAALRADPRAAAVYYERALEQGYHSAIVYNNFGNFLAVARRFEEAEESLKKALTLDPQLAAGHHNLARVEFHLAFREHRSPDLGPITRATALGPETAQLDLDVARTYILRSKYANEDGARREYFNKVFQALTRGLERGFRDNHLEEVAVLNPALKSDPRWKQLKDMPPSEIPFTYSALVLDPFSETKPPATTVAAAVASR